MHATHKLLLKHCISCSRIRLFRVKNVKRCLWPATFLSSLPRFGNLLSLGSLLTFINYLHMTDTRVLHNYAVTFYTCRLVYPITMLQNTESKYRHVLLSSSLLNIITLIRSNSSSVAFMDRGISTFVLSHFAIEQNVSWIVNLTQITILRCRICYLSNAV